MVAVHDVIGDLHGKVHRFTGSLYLERFGRVRYLQRGRCIQDKDALAITVADRKAVIIRTQHGNLAGVLVTRLAAQRHQRLWVVHRLDKDVSGVILFAKHAEAHRYLNEQFRRRRVDKTYLALVHGQVTPARDVIG